MEQPRIEIVPFSQALQDSEQYSNRHLLLGNGFSIACRPTIFRYARLYEQAAFGALSSTAQLAFGALGTQDFERVIRSLRDAIKIVGAYLPGSALPDSLAADADALRELLVQTIAASHPSWPGEISEQEYRACRAFIGAFKTVYTLNYDLLLYWAQMHKPEGTVPASDDGFRSIEGDPEATYVAWEPAQSHAQNTWFLHGALHIFDTGIEIQKYTWCRTGVRLIDQIREALARDYFPLFVSEGTSREKFQRVRHSDYLAKGYRSFAEIQGALFVYGHSLDCNDDHYLQCIPRGRISHLYVSLYGEPGSDENKFVQRRASALAASRRRGKPLAVTFFDASSAAVWG